MSHKKFGPDRFIRFNVYWIQTNKQTNKHPNRQTRQIYIQIVLLYHSRVLLEECVKRDMVQIQNILYYCIFVLLYFCIIVGFYQRSVLRYMIQIQNILYYCIILLLYYYRHLQDGGFSDRSLILPLYHFQYKYTPDVQTHVHTQVQYSKYAGVPEDCNICVRECNRYPGYSSSIQEMLASNSGNTRQEHCTV